MNPKWFRNVAFLEQQFGNFQNPNDMELYKIKRNNFGRFYYRFPQGESGLDCYNRVTSFISTLFREWNKDTEHQENVNIVLVTHGLLIRLFLMRWFQYTVEEFEASTNPHNGSVLVMERRCSDTVINPNGTGGFGEEHLILTEESRQMCSLARQHLHDKDKPKGKNTSSMSHEQLQRVLKGVNIDMK